MARADEICHRLAHTLAVGFLAAVTLLGGAATVASLGARQLWLLDLATHFRPQLAFILALCALGLALLRAPGWAALATLGATYNLLFVVPLFLPAHDPSRLDAQPVRLMLSNVRRRNQDAEAVLSVVRKEAPDVIVLLETDPRWQANLAPLSVSHPHQAAVIRPDPFGLMVASRHPLTEVLTRTLGTRAVPAISARLSVDGAVARLFAAHLVPPLSGTDSAERNRELAELAVFTRGLGGATVLCADLNVSPWSPHFADLAKATGLVDARRGFGLAPSWGPGLTPFLTIPIDHCLVSPEVGVRGFRTGPPVGSDHLPVLVDLALPRQ